MGFPVEINPKKIEEGAKYIYYVHGCFNDGYSSDHMDLCDEYDVSVKLEEIWNEQKMWAHGDDNFKLYKLVEVDISEELCKLRQDYDQKVEAARKKFEEKEYNLYLKLKERFEGKSK